MVRLVVFVQTFFGCLQQVNSLKLYLAITNERCVCFGFFDTLRCLAVFESPFDTCICLLSYMKC